MPQGFRSVIPVAFCLLIASVLASPFAQACEVNTARGVWLLPAPVVIAHDIPKQVAGIVACSALSDGEGKVEFKLNIMDADESIAEIEEGADDVLVETSVSGMVSGPNQLTALVAARVSFLNCFGEKGVYGLSGNSHEGQASSDAGPADLALQIDNSRQQPFRLPESETVPARCTDAGILEQTISLLYVGFPGAPDFPQLPPIINLPFNASFQVKSGGAHFEPITNAGGMFPTQVTVNAVRMSKQTSRLRKGQAAPLSLTVGGSGSFVEVSGTVTQDGVIEASGEGTVAGFQNIDVMLTGTLQAGVLNAEYSMGTDGALPGGFPIVFDLSGTSPDIGDFWQATGDAIVGVAQEMAAFNAVTPVGGLDVEEPLVRQAANLVAAQAGLRFFPTSGNAEGTLAGIAVRLNEFADQVAVSTMVNRTAAEQALRNSAQSFGQSGQQLGALLDSPPGEVFNEDLAAWLATLSQSLNELRTFTQASFGTEVFTPVPAANFIRGPLALDSLVSGFGLIGAEDDSALTIPLPTELGDFSIILTDSEGAEHLLGLLFSSSGQINFVLPPRAATGPGLLTVFSGETVVATGVVLVSEVAPGLFTANATGEGVPAALLLRIEPDGSTTFANVFTDAPLGERTARPVDLSDEDVQYFLVLFGSGFRNASELKVRIAGEEISGVAFAPSGEFEALDQANVPLSRDLMGRGIVAIELEADGIVANGVKISFL